MQDVYSLILWIVPGAIMMRVMARLTDSKRSERAGDLDLLVSYLIASVPVYGIVKGLAWLVEWAGSEGFQHRALASKGWFVVLSWPTAVLIGLAVAPLWRGLRLSRRKSS